MLLSALMSLPFALASAPSNPSLQMEPCEFGTVHPGTDVSCKVTVTNTSDTRFHLQRVLASDPGLTVQGLPQIIQPGATETVALKWHVGTDLGQHMKSARVEARQADSDAAMSVMLRGKGFVYSLLNQRVKELKLGDIKAGTEETKSVEFRSDDMPEFKIDRVVSMPPFLVAHLANSGRQLQVGLSDKAQWGLQSGTMVLATNTPVEPTIRINVSANVLGTVRPSDNPYALGVLRKGHKNKIAVQLTSIDDKPFDVGDITLEHIAGKATVQPCLTPRGGCKQIELTISPSQPTGNLGSRMHIELPRQGKELTVGFWGILLKPDTKIIDLDKSSDAASEGAMSKAGSESIDIGKALQHRDAAPSIPPSDPPGQGPVLRWSVANEQTVYGYLIYRADKKDGPFQRVNDEIIPVLGHDDTSSTYAWRDTSAVIGKTYWYFIKTLLNNGAKEKLSDAQNVVAHK